MGFRDTQTIHEQNEREATRWAHRKAQNVETLLNLGQIEEARAEFRRVCEFFDEALQQASKASDARAYSNFEEGIEFGKGE
jgi:hypothetical protein